MIMALDALLLYGISDRAGNSGTNPFGDSTLAKIEELSLKYKPDFILTDEFRGTSHFIMDSRKILSTIAQSSGANVVLTPEHYYSSEHQTWGAFAKEMDSAGIQIEDVIGAPYSPDSVGFYFGRDGMMYAFPKQWEHNPIHRIPNTRIAVTICGEINHLKPEMLDGISLLLNPSLEGDDCSMGVRDMIAAGVPQDAVLERFSRDWGVTREEILERIKSPPAYAKGIYDVMQAQGILALRSDHGRWESGILSLPPGASIAKYVHMPSPPFEYVGENFRRRIGTLPFGLSLVRYQDIDNRVHTSAIEGDNEVYQSEVLHLPRGLSVVKTVQRPTQFTHLSVNRPS